MSPRRVFGVVTNAEERIFALRLAVVYSITFCLILAVPLTAGFLVYNDITDNRLRDNREFAERIEAERIERTKAINAFIYEQCLQDELRDYVVVAQLQAAVRRARASLPPGRLLNEQLDTLRDGIAALEPPDEPDCNPPAATRP